MVQAEQPSPEAERAVIDEHLTRACIQVPNQAKKLFPCTEAGMQLSTSVTAADEMTGACAVTQFHGEEGESADEKRHATPFGEVEWLGFSFRNLACIDNLQGLSNLVRLQLDNNAICKIQNLDHLVG